MIPPPGPPALPSVFAPTRRPGESITQGLGQGEIIPDDPDVLLRALYRILPHPDIARLFG